MSSSINNIENLREAAITLLREVESLANRQPQTNQQLGLQEQVQRYESELIREALYRTHGNQRRAAKLLGVKVTTLNCKIKRLGISIQEPPEICNPSTDYADFRQNSN